MTEEEFRSGDGVIHGEPSLRYIRNAIVTCSPDFHGDKVSRSHFVGRINGAIDALNKLDQLKKTLFYGRDNNLNPAEGVKSVAGVYQRVGSGDINGINIIHAIIGIATEAGELLEALRADYNNDEQKTLDSVNLIEEVGDLFWYVAILLNEVGGTFEDAQRRNINKLRARYADKFSAAEANERNLAAERAILEDRNEPLSEERHTNYPIIKEAKAVGGKTAVEAATVEADQAFSNVQAAINNAEPVEQSTSDLDGELAKSPAARLREFPDERLSRQPIRSEDEKK